MFEVTLKCLDSRSKAVNWTRVISRAQLIEILKEMRLYKEDWDFNTPTMLYYVEFASAYRLFVNPVAAAD